jgi:hypothetical protein
MMMMMMNQSIRTKNQNVSKQGVIYTFVQHSKHISVYTK